MPREARGMRRRPDLVGVDAACRGHARMRVGDWGAGDGVSESNHILPHDYGPCQEKVVSASV